MAKFFYIENIMSLFEQSGKAWHCFTEKRYECGLIEREDFVNNRFSSIPSHMRKDAVVFKIKDNNLLITGKLKKGKMASLGDFYFTGEKTTDRIEFGTYCKTFSEQNCQIY